MPAKLKGLFFKHFHIVHTYVFGENRENMRRYVQLFSSILEDSQQLVKHLWEYRMFPLRKSCNKQKLYIIIFKSVSDYVHRNNTFLQTCSIFFYDFIFHKFKIQNFDLKYIGLGILKISSKNQHALEVESPVFQALYYICI